jgi:hypothetical protein
MAEIYNKGAPNLSSARNSPEGFLLISSIIVLAIMLVIVNFYLDGIIQERKIATIQNISPQAYYLAESGIAEAFWKLQNDLDWKDNFEKKKTWSASFTRSDVLVPGGSYTVSIENTDQAAAIITATSTIPTAESLVQRVVQTSVFKAINQLPTNNIALFSDSNITSIGTKVNVNGNGDVFTNNNLSLYLFSNWTVSGQARAVKVITVGPTSYLSSNGLFDQNHPPIPAQILMPEIDFDSTDPNSLKSQANQIYSGTEFSQMLKDTPILSLNGIIYVTGNVHIKNGDQLIINGALVSDGSLSVGNGGEKKGAASLIVNHTIPRSGIFTKKNITIGGFETIFNVNGLVYVGSNFRLQDGLERDVTASTTGAIITQSMDFFTAWDTVNINFNQTYINEALAAPLFSPVLLINHWEEEY